MIRITLIAIVILFSGNLFAQKVIRSSIGCFGSSVAGDFSVVIGSTVSSPIFQIGTTSSGMSLQTRPFIHLRPNSTSSKVDITIYPNPSSDIVYIKTTAKYSSIRVTDTFGRLCFEGTESEISLGHLALGVYNIEIVLSNNGSYTQLLIIN